MTTTTTSRPAAQGLPAPSCLHFCNALLTEQCPGHHFSLLQQLLVPSLSLCQPLRWLFPLVTLPTDSGPAGLPVSTFPIGNCLHCRFRDDLYLHVLPASLGSRCLLCPGRGSQYEAVGHGGAPQPLGKQVENNPFQGSPPDALSLQTWYGAEESVLLKKLPGDIGGQAGWRPSARHRHCLITSSDSDAQRRQHHLSLRVCPLPCAANLSSTYLFLLLLAQN